jgi:hypothetical protein
MAPIIATVVIIVTTLVLSVAVTGFIFGLSSSSANTAEVEVVGTTIPTEVNVGASIAVCSPNPISSGGGFGPGGGGGMMALHNSGTVSARANSLVITFAGGTYDVVPSGSCYVAPDSTLYLLVFSLPATISVITGTPFVGYVSMGNGADVLFAGSFV